MDEEGIWFTYGIDKGAYPITVNKDELPGVRAALNNYGHVVFWRWGIPWDTRYIKNEVLYTHDEFQALDDVQNLVNVMVATQEEPIAKVDTNSGDYFPTELDVIPEHMACPAKWLEDIDSVHTHVCNRYRHKTQDHTCNCGESIDNEHLAGQGKV